MNLSKRVLTKWRKEALVDLEELKKLSGASLNVSHTIVKADRILLLTQELLDQHLLKEANKDGK